MAFAAMALCVASAANGQTEWGALVTNRLNYIEDLGNKFKGGDTNLPLLRLDSFAPLQSRVVDKSGIYAYGWYNGISSTSNHGGDVLDATNLLSLAEILNTLPPSAPGPVPILRQLVVSGIRSNQWFRLMYSLDNLPEEVRKIEEILGTARPRPKANQSNP